MSKTFEIPEEPEEGARVIDGSGEVWVNRGGWDDWQSNDGESCSWIELLNDYGPLRELVLPTEALALFEGKTDPDELYKIYSQTRSDVLGKALGQLVEFVRAFA